MEVDGTRHSTRRSERLKNSKPASLSRHHESMTQGNPQTLFWPISCADFFLWAHSVSVCHLTHSGEGRETCLKGHFTPKSNTVPLAIEPNGTIFWNYFISTIRKVVPAWGCSQQGLWIILSNCVMMFGKRHRVWIFQMYILVLWAPQAECCLVPSCYREGTHLYGRCLQNCNR